MYTTDYIIMISTTIHLISLLVRAPSSVMVSSPTNPILTGSSLTLTCTIMLVEDKINSVELEVVWTGPTDNLTADTTPTGTGTSYTSNLTITSLTASDAGTYTCTARLTSSQPLIMSSGSVSSNSSTISLVSVLGNSHTRMHASTHTRTQYDLDSCQCWLVW